MTTFIIFLLLSLPIIGAALAAWYAYRNQLDKNDRGPE